MEYETKRGGARKHKGDGEGTKQRNDVEERAEEVNIYTHVCTHSRMSRKNEWEGVNKKAEDIARDRK